MTLTPSKYQYQARVTAEKFDAVEIEQTDTGAATVLRPVIALGGSESGVPAEGGVAPDPHGGKIATHDAVMHADNSQLLNEILTELRRMSFILEGMSK